MSDSVTPWTVARQSPLSMGCPRQEYWSGLPFPPPGDPPDPGIKYISPALVGGFFFFFFFLPLIHLQSPVWLLKTYLWEGKLVPLGSHINSIPGSMTYYHVIKTWISLSVALLFFLCISPSPFYPNMTKRKISFRKQILFIRLAV